MSTTLVPFRFRVPDLFNNFREEMNHLMEDYNGGRNLQSPVAQFNPELSLAETESAFEVSLDLPGMNPEEIDVEMKNGELWITGERKGETEVSGKTWHREERYFGRFRRLIRLGDGVDAERLEAEYKDGVLRITAPKAEAVRPKKIEVRC